MNKYTGKNLEELLKTVAKEKEVSVEDLTYEVIEEKKGILGIGASVTIEAYALSDVKEFIFDYLGNFFTNLNQDIEIEIIQNEDSFKVMLNAENNAILIGKNGQTLHAINTVLRGAVNSHFKRKMLVLVDVNGYKQDRYAKVKAMSTRIAKTVQRTKVSALLDPMPNDERKIIHQHLAGMRNIRTESEGEGRNRRLRIIYDPKANPSKKQAA